MIKTLIWDLDETILDSSHRTPNNADGTLNLDAYIAKHNRKNVFKDKHLNLIRVFRHFKKLGYYTVICTARRMAKFDYDYLNFHNIHADLILSRENTTKEHHGLNDGLYKLKHLLDAKIDFKTAIMFDDSSLVKSTLREAGLTVLCAHKINERL